MFEMPMPLIWLQGYSRMLYRYVEDGVADDFWSVVQNAFVKYGPVRVSLTLPRWVARKNALCARSGTVPVEIVQPGVKSKAASKNTCDPTNPDIVPLATPPYSKDQYDNLTLLYLRAALSAGIFPHVTTHFAVDASVEGHCDPRCFDLGHFYDTITQALGHRKGSTYGVTPSYGRTWGKHNVWWDDTICHGKHP